ncbi:MAG: hypothetical protein K0Q63_640 [Paenibacillus sp.]|nr:hypothetical protein [Paenibacillus sp.]
MLIVLLLLGSLSYVWVERSTDLIMGSIAENAELSLSQVSANIGDKLLSYEEIVNTLYSDNTLQKEFMQHYDDLREAYDIYFNKQIPFERAILTTKDVNQIDIFTDNPTYVFSNVQLIDESVESSDWYGQVLDSSTGSVWTKPYLSETNQTQVFSIKKRLNNLVKDAKLFVSVEVHMRVLYDLVQEESRGKRYIIALKDGTVLVDSAPGKRISTLSELAFGDELQTKLKGNRIYEEDGHSYMVLHNTLTERVTISGIQVISFVPLDEVMPKVQDMRNLAILLFAGTCAISAIVIYLFSIGLTRRISELSRKMRRVDKDGFQTSVDVRGNDEISVLGQMFNQMVGRIGQLIKEVYQSEIDRKELALRTKEVELYALQTQINPHFLFNVLNMIRGKLLISGDRDTAKAVGLLAKSFRMMLRGGGQSIELSQEIEFITNYLLLQQYRYGDKLTYEISFNEEDLSIAIPRLCLQPLVENAISHGIELKEAPSRIRVKGERTEEGLIIRVEDDGLGIPAEKLSGIREWFANQPPLTQENHIGLRNVDQRLKHLYGEGSGLSIDSEEGKGTVVTMTIPVPSGRRGERDA